MTSARRAFCKTRMSSAMYFSLGVLGWLLLLLASITTPEVWLADKDGETEAREGRGGLRGLDSSEVIARAKV